MKNVKKQQSQIRTKLLESACRIFAEKGYREATVAEICEAANANVASINYYFGDKATLYKEAWLLSFNKSLETYPPDGGVAADAPVEERFKGRILAAVRRFSDPKSYEYEIMSKELSTPTGLLSKVIQESIEPLRQELIRIVRELLGKHSTEQQAILCQRSIMGQCLNLTLNERRKKVFREARMESSSIDENISIEEIANHIVNFSLAGVVKIRYQIENKHTNQMDIDKVLL
jgi:AcrR family transcriptional regulator